MEEMNVDYDDLVKTWTAHIFSRNLWQGIRYGHLVITMSCIPVVCRFSIVSFFFLCNQNMTVSSFLSINTTKCSSLFVSRV
jgi:hypothetical protein